MPRLRFLLLLLAPIVIAPTLAHAQAAADTSIQERVDLHHSAEWMNLSAHLPDPNTASPQELETAADVLRARRFPEDALDYYGYALARGGKMSDLLNKMGVTRLELGQYAIARALFQRVVREDKHNAVAWNNLGATEYLFKQYQQALIDYRKASSLQKKNPVFHANLGLTYFEMNDMDDMRVQFSEALALNAQVLTEHDAGGDSAHLVASGDYPRLCFEMARLYSRDGNLPAMRLWLAKASEAGFDVAGEMRDDIRMSGYLKDPEVIMMLHNAELLRKRNVATIKNAPLLGPATPLDTSPNPSPNAAPAPANKLL